MNGRKTKKNENDKDLWMDLLEEEENLDNEALYYT